MAVIYEAFRSSNAKHSFLNNSLIWNYILKSDWVENWNTGWSILTLDLAKVVSAVVFDSSLYRITVH